MTAPQSPHWTTPLACVLGGLCAALGLVVLYGWHTHNLALLHVRPQWVAMAYNTALEFLLCGAALLAAGLGRPRWAAVGAAAGLVVGLLTLAEYAFGVRLGLDEMFLKAYTRAGVVSYARMSLSTAACFSLTSTALLLSLLPPRRAWRPPLMALLGSVAVGLAAVALAAYTAGIVGVIRAYAWGQLTRMAVHTALGFLALGAGVTALAARRGEDDGVPAIRLLPVLVGVAVAAAALCAWQALVVEEAAQLDLIRRLEAGGGLRLTALARTQSLVPDGALACGLLLAALLAWAIHLAQAAREAKGGLEVRVAERTAELAQANRALRDVLLSVSEGRFHLCDGPEDLPPPLGGPHAPVALTRSSGLAEMRHRVRRTACDLGFPDERWQDLETAVGEAAMNAAVHGGGGEGWVLADEAGKVQVWVRDAGAGITMEHLPRATLERGYTTAGTLGHGFWLMLNVVDRLWLLTGPAGTTVVLEQGAAAPEPAWLKAGAPTEEPQRA